MKKEFVEPEVEVVVIDDPDVICASCTTLDSSSSATQGVSL
jgi:hypothetical protein